MQKLTAFTLSFISVALVFYVLIAGQAIIVPFLIALVIAYFIIALAEGIRKVRVDGAQIPRLISFLIAFMLIFGALYAVGTMLSSNVSALIEAAPVYQEKLQNLFIHLFDMLGKPLPDISKKFEEFDFASLLTQIVFVLTDIAGAAGLIAVYVLFILMEYHFFDQKIIALFKSDKGKDSARAILKKIAKQIQSYLRIKTLISLLTAVCSYALMMIVGVDFAEFWALLIFFLNYIPTIGSIIATIFPSLLTLLQFGEVLPFAIVSLGLVSLQFFVGNFLEPRIMGRQFNLSGLAIILSLAIWGQIWGIIGMLLCVPLLMMISIILANFPETRSIAIILSQTGKIEDQF